MSGAPFEHPLLSGLFGDQEVASLFSAEAQIRAILAVEAALVVRLCEPVGGTASSKRLLHGVPVSVRTGP